MLGGCNVVPRGGEVAELCSEEERRARRVRLLLRRVQGANERPLQRPQPPKPHTHTQKSLEILLPLSNLST